MVFSLKTKHRTEQPNTSSVSRKFSRILGAVIVQTEIILH
uniref:Uncharacterized protein n=1 Tax=Arundo donax TaxID=35708 RepID=A0A0A9AZV0_ARUDO